MGLHQQVVEGLGRRIGQGDLRPGDVVDITEVQDMPWGARHAHFTDLDGNPWDLQQPSGR